MPNKTIKTAIATIQINPEDLSCNSSFAQSRNAIMNAIAII
jgi:hypothetical protein